MGPAGAVMSSLPSRLLRRIAHERASRRLERDFARLMGTRAATAPGDGPVIGFATFGSGPWHLAIESLLAHALRQRGARPSLLVCDLPDLPICDERTIDSRDRDRCAGCVADKRALLETSALPWCGTSRFLDADTLARARATAARLDRPAIDAHMERGWPVGQWLHVSACHYLRCDARGETAEKVETRRRWLVTAIVMVEAVTRWLDEVRPDVVVAESGAHVMWRIALELARARGIPVVCREMGKGGWDQHLYALNRDCMAPDLAEAWADARRQPLSAAERAAVDQFLDTLPARTYVPQRPAVPSRREDLRARWRIPGDVRVAAAFTNVTWDLATAGRDVAFAGVFDWAQDTIRALAPWPRAHLVVRAHPAEASVRTRERIVDTLRAAWPSGLPRVTLVAPEEPLAARDVYELADLVLIYNSTTGIEAAAHGRAVLVCGDPHFRGRGFTIDVPTREAYARTLAAWAAGDPLPAPDDAAELARRYAHLFYLRYHVPMGWTTSPLEPPFHLTMESLDELAPGRNPALDVVCSGILQARQVLLPRRTLA